MMTKMNKPPTLDAKRVVIVGGATGIGRAVAELAASQGATVVVGSRRGTGIDQVDVRDEASVARFFDGVGAFDHLAITAGDWDFPRGVALEDLDLVKARDAFGVRFWGALAAIKHATKSIARDGSVVLTSGIGAHRPRKGSSLMVALGGAVEFLARGLAIDLAPVRVNAVCPGLVLTELVEANYPQAMRDAFVAPLPLPRTATPVEAAQAYVYLMLNGYTTGQVVAVDGGGLLV
jgi:NAD(P)-dependent dehydrogenase (short-subunit alcohol dehydrogenase family)